MKRIVTVAIWAAFAGLPLPGTMAQAQTASSGLRIVQAQEPAVTDVSAQRRRPLRRVPIYRQELLPLKNGEPTPTATNTTPAVNR